MDGAKNASRLGGLTVAVGLGFAVSSGQGVAYADTDSADSGSAGASVSSGSSDTDSAASTDSEQREQPTRRGKIRLPGRDAESADPDDAPRRELSPRRLKIREALRSADESVDSSTDQAAGKLADAAPQRAVAEDSPSSLTADEPSAAVDSAPDLTEVDPSEAVGPAAPVAEETLAEVELLEPTEPVEPVESVEPVEPTDEAPAPDPAPGPDPAAGGETSEDPAVAESSGTNQREEAARELGAGSDPGDATAEPTGTTVSLDVIVPEAVINPLLAAQVSSHTDPVTLTSRPAFHPIVELLAIPLRIVTGLFGLIGLAPGATVPGAPVSPVTKLLELAWVALRRVNSFFFNSTPTATVTLDQTTNSSIITGRVVGYDPDGDPLEYQVVEPPTHGALQLNADGTFTYRATAAAVAAGVTDTFRISVVDKGFHFHGLLGFLKPGRGHGTVAEVTVNLARTNTAPVIERLTTVITPNGAVGTVRITDDGDNPLQVGVSQPPTGWGSVTIAHLEDDTWQWTLTAPPGRPHEDVLVAFVITASDGQMTRAQAVQVTVPASSWVVVDTTIIHLPIATEVSPIPPITITQPDGGLLVNWNNNIYLTDPTTGITTDLSLPANTIVSTGQIIGELIIIDSGLSVNTGTLNGSQLVIHPTGITLTETPTSMTTVGGSLVVGGGALVTTTDTKLTVYGPGNLPVEFSGTDIFGHDDDFIKVVSVGDSNAVVTSRHRMSHLQTAFDLGAWRAMSSDAQPTVGVEVLNTVDFGDGVIGALATRGESVYVTVTEGDLTRLIKYDANYYGLEEQSSVELGGSVSGLAISEDGSFAYVADSAAGTVTIVAIQDYYYGMDIIDTVRTGPGHVSALSGGRLAVADPGSGTVTVIQLD